MSRCATSIMLLLQRLWGRVLSIQQGSDVAYATYFALGKMFSIQQTRCLVYNKSADAWVYGCTGKHKLCCPWADVALVQHNLCLPVTHVDYQLLCNDDGIWKTKVKILRESLQVYFCINIFLTFISIFYTSRAFI